MKWLADEGVDRQIVDELRAAGHDVRYVAEMGRGTPDSEVLELGREAIVEARSGELAGSFAVLTPATLRIRRSV